MSSARRPGPRIGTQITAAVVCLIDEDGTRVGDVSLTEALQRADDCDKDLVEVAASMTPPVCRIVDYNKMRYEQARNRTRNKPAAVKEIKYGLRIGSADFDTKTGKVRGFLEGGHRVKVTVQLRGRERSRPQTGRDLLARVSDAVADISRVEGSVNGSTASMTLLLVPAQTSTG